MLKMGSYLDITYKTIILFLLTSCAIQISPEGGPKDITPPKLTKSDPTNKSVNFEKTKINLYFNEYVGITNPAQEIIISPLITPQPKISIHKKGIIIKFEEKLKENTTYTIQFGKSIADITENNVLADLTYVFSTGPKLDSLKIQGNVKEALTNKPGENIKIMLHKPGNDSCVYKIKPEYYSKTNKKGEFSVNNLHNNTYLIYALDDENSNYLFDKGERIAFANDTIDLSSKVPSIDLNLFKENEEKIKAIDNGRKDRNKFYIDFNAPVDSLSMSQLINGNQKAIKTNIKIIETRDSAYFWLFPETDTLKIIIDMWGENHSCDTLLINIDKKDVKQKKPSKLKIKTVNKLYTTGKIFLEFNEPVTKIDFSKILFYLDTNKVASFPDLKFIDSSYTQMLLTYPFEYDKNYKMIINKGALTGFDTIINDSILIPLKTMKETDLGIITVNISIIHPGTPIIVQLLDDTYKVLKEDFLKESGKMVYSNLLPGKYRIRCIVDANKNGKWDTGNLLKRRQPEEIIYFKDDINLKANWELNDLQIKIP